MKIERLKKLFPVIQALVEGKKVQWRNIDGIAPWADLDVTSFYLDSEGTEWRIKPSPRQYWIAVRDDSHTYVLDKYPTIASDYVKEYIHVKEVL